MSIKPVLVRLLVTQPVLPPSNLKPKKSRDISEKNSLKASEFNKRAAATVRAKICDTYFTITQYIAATR